MNKEEKTRIQTRRRFNIFKTHNSKVCSGVNKEKQEAALSLNC